MKKILLGILVLVLIIGGITGGYWYGKENVITKNETVKTKNVSGNNIFLKDMSITNAGIGLKKYENNKYGFSFSYPAIYNLDVNVNFDSTSSISLKKVGDNIGNFSIEVLQNPTLTDPLTNAKKLSDECLAREKEFEAKGEPTGILCNVISGNMGQWKTIKINDRYTGYRTGIQPGTILTDTYYLFDSQYKGKILKFTANITATPPKNNNQDDLELTIRDDENMKNFLAVFDQIISSATVSWLDN